jgi:amino acid permease
MKTIIGAGVLSLPFTISKLGYVLAIIIFVLVMSLSYFSTTLLVKVKNLSKHSNFSTIFYFLHKNRLVKGLGSIFIVLKNVGICTSLIYLGTAELTIFKESIRKMIKDFVTDE